MDQVKYFEVCDEGTLIPVMAVFVNFPSQTEQAILRRGGYRVSVGPLVFLTELNNRQTCYFPYEWHAGRTLRLTHLHLEKNWDQLESGSVIDVEYLLGLTQEPKKSAL
jgi:hypothetical protein